MFAKTMLLAQAEEFSLCRRNGYGRPIRVLEMARNRTWGCCFHIADPIGSGILSTDSVGFRPNNRAATAASPGDCADQPDCGNPWNEWADVASAYHSACTTAAIQPTQRPDFGSSDVHLRSTKPSVYSA